MSECKESQEVFSEKIKAGKRTYFFDVKSTRQGDYYLTITESKKELTEDRGEVFKKRTVFVYKEDIVKFEKALSTCVSQMRSLMPEYDLDDYTNRREEL